MDSNGQHWAVTYMHRFTSSGSDFDIRVASVYLTGSTIDVAEGPLTLAASSTIESRPKRCARRTGGTNSNFVGAVWTDQFAGAQQGDIEGATYQMLDAFGQISFPSALQTATPAANPPG
ncbi:MAG: hypothetical protein R3F17_10320 [Planctomycetota bacterium]